MWLTLGVLVKGELKGKAELSASGRTEDRGERDSHCCRLLCLLTFQIQCLGFATTPSSRIRQLASEEVIISAL